MSENAPKFTLPAEPVDGYVLEYWDADIETYRLATADPSGFRATYHVNTPWANHPWSDGTSGAAPFVDDWAIETIAGAAQGRREGWESTAKLLNADEDIFPSRLEALERIRQRIARRIVLLGQEKNALHTRLREINAEVMKPAEVKP